MRLRSLFFLLMFFLLLAHENSMWAQQENQDKIIAGKHLQKLWDAIRVKDVTITDPELRSQILDHELSVIFLPWQLANERKVRRCFNRRTAFERPDLVVSLNDYAQLLMYAEKGAYQKVAALSEAIQRNDLQASKEATMRLNESLNSLPPQERASARMLVGSWLADLGPTQTELAIYVSEFRNFIETTTFNDSTNIPIVATLLKGVPYSIGSSSLTAIDLRRINPSDVESITLQNIKFRKAWNGSNLIIVPQDVQSSHILDTTGLGMSATWAANINIGEGGGSKLVPRVH